MVKRKEEKEAAKKYNLIAEHYHNLRTKGDVGWWFYNEGLEMPATLELLRNVKGKKILDMGCGSGIYAKLLTKKGAIVKGFDISREMLKIAKKNNPKLELVHGSAYKIPFNEKFDIVQASLMLDYLSNWDKVFREVRKVLKNRGYFIFSVGNPVSECVKKKIFINGKKIRTWDNEGYFGEKPFYTTWKVHSAGLKVKMPSYHKTYETIIKTIIKNGFEIVDYKDAFPIRKAKKIFPLKYKIFSKIPYFCVWKARIK